MTGQERKRVYRRRRRWWKTRLVAYYRENPMTVSAMPLRTFYDGPRSNFIYCGPHFFFSILENSTDEEIMTLINFGYSGFWLYNEMEIRYQNRKVA